MIKLDITSFIFAYTLFSAIIILIVWIIFGYKRMMKFQAKDTDYMWECSVCSHIYIDSKYEDISLCPLCGSYNKKEKQGFILH